MLAFTGDRHNYIYKSHLIDFALHSKYPRLMPRVFFCNAKYYWFVSYNFFISSSVWPIILCLMLMYCSISSTVKWLNTLS